MEQRIINNNDKTERTITMTVSPSDPLTINPLTDMDSSIKELEQKFTRMEDQIGLDHLKVNHEFSDIKTNLKNAVNDLQLQDRNIKYGMNKRCDEISAIVKTQGQELTDTNEYVDILAEVHNRSVTYYKLKFHKVNIKLKDMATILRWLAYLNIILLAVLIGMVAAIVVYM